MNKKWVTIGVLVVLVAGGGYWGYRHFSAKPAAVSLLTAPAKMGDVSKVITATGTVNFLQTTPLSFQQSGKLTAINVKAGDMVTKGQVLAQIDTTDLQLAVNQEQANLAAAQAKLQQALDGVSATDLAAVAQAQQQVTSAQQSMTTAEQDAAPAYLANQVSLAQQNVQAASNSLASAMVKAQQTGDSSAVQAAQQALTQAQAALTTAQQQQNGGAAQVLTQAKATYASAQAALAQAESQASQDQGTPSANVLAAQATVLQAQAALSTAQTNLADATLTAPADGLITDVAASVGASTNQSVGSSTTIMTLATDPKNLEVDTSVDQADISNVKVGQKTDITLDSYPNVDISGTVSQIAVQGTVVQNVTTYDVTVLVDTPNALLKAGMNANVNIILAQAKNVLTVPSAAIRGSGTNTGVLVPGPAPGGSGNTGSSGKAGGSGYTGGNRAAGASGRSGNSSGSSGSSGATGRFSRAGGAMANANEHFVPVVIGLDDGTNVEIKSGLTAGEEVVIGVQSSTGAAANAASAANKNSSNPGRAMGSLGRVTSGR